jgi:hypothetical protein
MVMRTYIRKSKSKVPSDKKSNYNYMKILDPKSVVREGELKKKRGK